MLRSYNNTSSFFNLKEKLVALKLFLHTETFFHLHKINDLRLVFSLSHFLIFNTLTICWGGIQKGMASCPEKSRCRRIIITLQILLMNIQKFTFDYNTKSKFEQNKIFSTGFVPVIGMTHVKYQSS